ncbi:hypothetical protein K432DRAFT_416509 [Lepidopterella palustris CBS 459.81]|uniref:Uncharacterized protein n=1 Tax=Lepidopterella palustris CBS 459.81 TaxID=1314670 RepID=A0A8E2JG55_9PEZI|nr:hypothetical protein K432DRAFT_416509 [Lepidopterella palustris CBS 459.81]
MPADHHQITRPMEVLRPAAQVGAFAGGAGLVVGGVSGIVRSATPILFATAAGIQWFALGSTFWGTTRGAILQRQGLLNWVESKRGAQLQERRGLSSTSEERVKASTIAGGITGGALAALLRGRRNIIPGVIMFTIFGYVGQSIYDVVDARKTREHKEKMQHSGINEQPNFIQRITKSRWSPVKVLSDEEYESMLNEKLLRIEADIALIDENIEHLKQQRDQSNED